MIEIILTFYIICATYVMSTVANDMKNKHTKLQTGEIPLFIIFAYMWPVLLVMYVIEEVLTKENVNV